MTESVNGTILTLNIATIPDSVSSITDSNGGVWTLVGGVPKLNGTTAGGGYNVSKIYYINGQISCINTSNAYYNWVSSAWSYTTTDPRAAVSITDANGDKWNLQYQGNPTDLNTVYRNYAPPAGSTATHVDKLAYYGHKVYDHSYASGNWWYWDGTTPWFGPVPDPTVTTNFWGVQTHVTWNWSLAACYQKPNWPTLISKLNDLGIKQVRNDVDKFSTSVLLDFINNYATPAGIKVIPTLLGDYSDGETNAYNDGHALGSACAVALTGKVPFFEVGNELSSDALQSGVGDQNSDYNNTYYVNARGFIRGMIAGVKAHDTTTPIIIGGNPGPHTAFNEMLWNGTQPNGGTAPTVRWDVTAGHFYANNNSVIDNPEDFNGLNILAKLAQFGKPVHLNEYGANWDEYSGESAVAAAIVGGNLMGKWVAKKATYNITYTSYYQLMDAAAQGTPTSDNEMNFGLVANNGSTNRGRYASVKTYIAAHP